jgi:hypothetical protein
MLRKRENPAQVSPPFIESTPRAGPPSALPSSPNASPASNQPSCTLPPCRTLHDPPSTFMEVEHLNLEAIAQLARSLSLAQSTEATPLALVDYGTASAKWLSELSESFTLLKRQGVGRSHKVLVRSILECTFYVVAVCRKPELIWQVFIHQWQEEGNMLPDNPPEYKATHLRNKEAVRRRFQSMFGHEPLKDNAMSAYGAAKEADLIEVYQKFYRLYCKYSHGSLKGIVGEFDSVTDPLDSWLVAVGLAIVAECLQRQNFVIELDVGSIQSSLMNRKPSPAE